MKVNGIKALYFMYCVMVVASFLQSIDISPYIVKFIFNKLLYLFVSLSLIIIFFYKKIKLASGFGLSIKFLFAYVFFYAIASFYHLESGWMGGVIGNGIFYFLTFLIFHLVSKLVSFEQLLAPFLIMVGGLIGLSFAMMAGLQIQYYHPDENLVEGYLLTKSSGLLTGFSGVYLNQNAFVVLAFIGVVVFLLKYQILKHSGCPGGSYFYMAMMMGALVCALMTMSRAGLLACAIVLFLYFIKNIKNKTGLLILLLMVFFILVATYYLGEYANQLAIRIENDGTSNRDELWGDAINVFFENPILGAGDYKYYTPIGYLTAHNIYIQILASQGIIVFLCWLGFLLPFIKSSFKNIVASKIFERPIAVISSAAFLALLVHQFFETMIIGFGAPIILFMFLLMNFIKDASPIESKIGAFKKNA